MTHLESATFQSYGAMKNVFIFDQFSIILLQFHQRLLIPLVDRCTWLKINLERDAYGFQKRKAKETSRKKCQTTKKKMCVTKFQKVYDKAICAPDF